MRRTEIIASGDITRYWCRNAVWKIARGLGITGCVMYMGQYDVKVIAEGDEEILKQFIEAIKIDYYPIFVKKLDVEWGSATGEFDYFKIIPGDFPEEMCEWLDLIIAILDSGLRNENGFYGLDGTASKPEGMG